MASFLPENSQERLEERKGQFKATIDPGSMKEKRAESQVQIRKDRRNLQLTKRRMLGPSTDNTETMNPLNSETLELFKSCATQLRSTNVAQQLEVATQLRKILAHAHAPPIGCLVASGTIPVIVSALRVATMPELQFELIWVLTNTASGSHEETGAVVDAGAVSLLVELCSSPHTSVREQSVWALGNICGDSAQYRDLCLSAGTLGVVLEAFTKQPTKALIQNAAWTLSNLLRGKPEPPTAVAQRSLPTLAKVIRINDPEAVADVCYALSNITDANTHDSNDRIQLVIESGVVQKLVELLLHPQEEVVYPALLTLSNIVAGDRIQTQVVIACNALFSFDRLLRSSNMMIRKETCFAISNITMGTHDQIGAVLRANLLQRLISMLPTEPSNIQVEIGFVLANITRGTQEHIETLVARGSIAPMVELLRIGRDAQLTKALLSAFNNIFKAGEQRLTEFGENKYVNYFDEVEGIALLEDIATSENMPNELSALAQRLLDMYFDLDEQHEMTQSEMEFTVKHSQGTVQKFDFA